MEADPHLDFGKGFKIYQLKIEIGKIRNAINEARTHNRPTVRYTMSFYPKTPINN